MANGAKDGSYTKILLAALLIAMAGWVWTQFSDAVFESPKKRLTALEVAQAEDRALFAKERLARESNIQDLFASREKIVRELIDSRREEVSKVRQEIQIQINARFDRIDADQAAALVDQKEFQRETKAALKDVEVCIREFYKNMGNTPPVSTTPPWTGMGGRTQ